MPSAARNILRPRLAPPITLATAPLDLGGDWGQMFPASARTVIERMRQASLEGVRLVSDRQPIRLRVERRTAGPPAIWLHPNAGGTAWILVHNGERAWSQLAYQFGHELGHVLANSWLAHAKPVGPSQWLEEAVVEAFSLRGLAILGRAWQTAPPFPGDGGYGASILAYREKVMADYRRLAAEQSADDLPRWIARQANAIPTGLSPYSRVVALRVLDELEARPGSAVAIGALNRWPGRARLELGPFLNQWRASCEELDASPDLPVRLRAALLGA